MSDFDWGKRHLSLLQQSPDQGIDELGRNEQDDHGHDR
jgi:hypothetical protein